MSEPTDQSSTAAAKAPSMVSRLIAGRGAMALLDQALISASNFGANIVLVRGLGLADFGKYYLAYAVILYINALQWAFITAPMFTIAPLLDGRKKESFLNGMLALQLIASVLLFVVCFLAGGIAHLFTNYYSLPCILAISCSIGTFQLQDWIRRYYFLVNKKKLAMVSDFISYFVQLVLLAALWRGKALTLTPAFTVMAVTSLAAFLMGPMTDRFSLTAQTLKEAWAECKGLSRDLLIANQLRWFGDQGILLMGTGIVGTAGIGGLRATQSLSGPVSLILSSLDNVLPMKIAEVLKQKGALGAYHFTRKAIFISSVLLTLLLLPIAIFGKPLLRLAFGAAVVAFYVPMLLQFASWIVAVSSRLWFYLYRGLRDTRAILRANLLCTLTGIASVFFLGHYFQASGIVLASLLGQVAIVVYCMMHWSWYREELLLSGPDAAACKA